MTIKRDPQQKNYGKDKKYHAKWGGRGEGRRGGGTKAEQIEGGDMEKGWKLKIECEI